MTERGIRRFVDLLLENHLISRAEYEEFIYVLLGDAEALIVKASILLLGIIAGQVLPTIGFMLFFFALRKRTGGYHLDSFLKCYISTLLLYMMIMVSAAILSEYTEALIVSAMASGTVIFVIGSVNHPNMDMEKDELRDSKTMARILVVTECVLILFLSWLKMQEMLVACLSMAVVLCAVLLILAKLAGQEVKE